MYYTIGVIVVLLVAVPATIFWLLRPRKGVKPGPFHDQVDDASKTMGGGFGGPNP